MYDESKSLQEHYYINAGEGGTLVLSDYSTSGARMSTESLIINAPVVKAERGTILDFSSITVNPAANVELSNQLKSLKICADLTHVERIKSRSLREIQLGDEGTTDSPADKLTLECRGLERLKVFNTLKDIEFDVVQFGEYRPCRLEEVLIEGDTTLHLRITNINQISLLEEVVDEVRKLNLNVAGTLFDAQTLMAPYRRLIAWQDPEYVSPSLVNFGSLEEISITGDNENQIVSVLSYMLTCEEFMALSRLQIEDRVVEPSQLIDRVREERRIWDERFAEMFLQSFAEIAEVTPSRAEVRAAREAEAERIEAERIADERRAALARIDRAERLEMDEAEQALRDVEQAVLLQITQDDAEIDREQALTRTLVMSSGFNTPVLRELSIVLPECQELSLTEAREVYRNLPGLDEGTRTILVRTLADDALYLNNPELTIIRKNELRHIARASRDMLRAEEDITGITYYLNQGFRPYICHLGQDGVIYALLRNLDLIETTVPSAEPGSPEMVFENALKLAIHKVRSISLERLKDWGTRNAVRPENTVHVLMRIQRLIYEHFGGAVGTDDPYFGQNDIGVVLLGDTEQTDRDILRHFIARCGFRVQALLPQITAELNSRP